MLSRTRYWRGFRKNKFSTASRNCLGTFDVKTRLTNQLCSTRIKPVPLIAASITLINHFQAPGAGRKFRITNSAELGWLQELAKNGPAAIHNNFLPRNPARPVG